MTKTITRPSPKPITHDHAGVVTRITGRTCVVTRSKSDERFVEYVIRSLKGSFIGPLSMPREKAMSLEAVVEAVTARLAELKPEA